MTKEKTKTKESKPLVEQIAPARGRAFEGTIIKKFPTRLVVESERVVKIQKYERFFKKKSRFHVKLPKGINVEVGDYVLIRECRPLSKIIHFILIKKIRSANLTENSEAKK